jgi:predicted amidophosphoribosyltransferase
MPLSLDQQLQLEKRICTQCGMEITNPFTNRCPRCLADVPVNDPGCARCLHSTGCPAKRFKNEDLRMKNEKQGIK